MTTNSDQVLVVGAGVVGLSTAFALLKAGLSVSVVSAGGVGDGATAANAALLVPADSLVWPGPENARVVPKTILGRGGASISIDWSNPAAYSWGARFLRYCTRRRFEHSTRAALALSRHSFDLMRLWASRHALDFGFEANGMVFLFGSAQARDEGRGLRDPLAQSGVVYADLAHDDLVELDPGYARIPADLCALSSPDAGHGNAVTFCEQLARLLTDEGVAIKTNSPVTRVVVERGRVVGVQSVGGLIARERVVLCAGHQTAPLARTAGVNPPILPVPGYAVTVPIRAEHLDKVASVGGVLESAHVAYSRFGGRLRLSTGAVIGGSETAVPAHARAHLRAAGDQLFPASLEWSEAVFQAGHRPMTPHGLPLIGPTAMAGLYLNSGHGSLGWTQSAGSADLLACLLTGRTPPLDPTPYLPRPRAQRTRAAAPQLA